MLSDKWLSKYGLLENFNTKILSFGYVLDFQAPSSGMDPRVPCCGMKVNPTRYLWCKYECFLTSGCEDMDLKKTLTQCEATERHGTGMCTAVVSTIALCTSCSRAKKRKISF